MVDIRYRYKSAWVRARGRLGWQCHAKGREDNIILIYHVDGGKVGYSACTNHYHILYYY